MVCPRRHSQPFTRHPLLAEQLLLRKLLPVCAARCFEALQCKAWGTYAPNKPQLPAAGAVLCSCHHPGTDSPSKPSNPAVPEDTASTPSVMTEGVCHQGCLPGELKTEPESLCCRHQCIHWPDMTHVSKKRCSTCCLTVGSLPRSQPRPSPTPDNHLSSWISQAFGKVKQSSLHNVCNFHKAISIYNIVLRRAAHQSPALRNRAEG